MIYKTDTRISHCTQCITELKPKTEKKFADCCTLNASGLLAQFYAPTTMHCGLIHTFKAWQIVSIAQLGYQSMDVKIATILLTYKMLRWLYAKGIWLTMKHVKNPMDFMKRIYEY